MTETDTRQEFDIQIPERIPWSQLAQDFAETWGRSDPKDPQPESVEVLGIQ